LQEGKIFALSLAYFSLTLEVDMLKAQKLWANFSEKLSLTLISAKLK